ncbi:ImmA/IrrE family metallo-endopeptidase [Peptococcaceae bacterium]|nr:ImmA/IrrE family metallo-endopeptidase [Peptococcaceae bacterium]
MNKVTVNSNVLNWAIERSGKTLSDLEHKFPKIYDWITDENQPTFHQLENFAKATLTPFGFFFLEEPPEESLPIPFFRTLRNEISEKPSVNLLETVKIMQQRQDWMRELLIEEGHEPLKFVNSVQSDNNVVLITQQMHDILNLKKHWAAKQPTWTSALSFLRETMEDAGILVVVNGIVGNNTHRKLDPVEFRGFVLADDYAPLVFVNGTDSKAAQIFTLAHELAHILIGSSGVFDLHDLQPADDPKEQLCNQAAAEFLVPETELRKTWEYTDEVDIFQKIQKITSQFKVSSIVVARRLLDLTLINKVNFLKFYREYQDKIQQNNTTKIRGGDFYRNQNMRVGKRFATAVATTVREGKLLYSEAYKLTGLYGKTFDSYIQQIGEPY